MAGRMVLTHDTEVRFFLGQPKKIMAGRLTGKPAGFDPVHYGGSNPPPPANEVMNSGIAKVDCKILRVTEEEDEEYKFTVELIIKTKHDVFFNKKGKFLGLLTMAHNPIDLGKALKLYFMDCKKEVIRHINKLKKKRGKDA